MIAVDSVSVGYGDVAVLEDVSLSVEEGTVLGLVGPNGAGKTTLLRTISGAIAPDRGTVTIDGSDVHALSSRAASRLVSVVPQDTTLSFSFDVRDVVAMGRTPYRSRFAPPTPEDRRLVDRALERTRTTGFADRPIDEVSGGERQRVILARAIAQDTPVTLLDEPTASLDVNHQVETFELVRELAADGRTIVAAIHDLDLAARFCDEIAVLADGSVLERGSPETVVTRDVIGRAFDANAVVSPDPITASPRVTAFSATENEPERLDRVHVVGAGSTAADVVSRLARAGVETSLGPIVETDVAAVTARTLDVERIERPPFSSLDDRTHRATRARIEAADVTVLAGRPAVGYSERLLDAVNGRPPLVTVVERSAPDRSGTTGSSDRRLESTDGVGIETTPEDVLEAVERATTVEARAADDGSTTDD